MVKRHYLDELEDKKDNYEDRIIQEIIEDLRVSLKDHEEYFFQETIKKIDLTEPDLSGKIEKAIDDVLVNDPNQYMQNVAAYRKYGGATGTLGDARYLYVQELKKKFVEQFSKSKTENQKIDEKEKLTNTLLEFPSKNDLTDQEWIDLQEIKKELKTIIGGLFYEDVVVEFLDQMKQKDGFSWSNVNDVVRGLIKNHRISGEKETLETDLSDCLLRLLPIMAKKK